jgi:hypothetical protein
MSGEAGRNEYESSQGQRGHEAKCQCCSSRHDILLRLRRD